jgi:uncharacterized protein (DUF1330 family)
LETYAIIQCAVDDSRLFDRFSELIWPTVPGHGAVVLARGYETEWFEGSGPLRSFVVLSFPTPEAARRWHRSPEYSDAALVAAEAGALTVVLVEG